MNNIKLTDENLLLLDGKVDQDTQKIIDFVKAKIVLKQEMTLTDNEAQFVQKIKELAENRGELDYSYKNLTSCQVCCNKASYVLYKSGPRKGKPNYDKPIMISGIELSRSFVSIKGYSSTACCSGCMVKLKPLLITVLKDIKAEIPEKLTNIPSKYKKYSNVKCIKCEWYGNEGEMGYLPSMMGGKYKGECPKCKAKNLPFGPTNIVNDKGFTVIENHIKKGDLK